MSLATYTQDGRNLHITLPDGGLDITVPPANLKTGRDLLTALSGIAVGYAPDEFVEGSFRLAVGTEHYDQLEQLRSEEFTEIINVVMFWQAYGGGWRVIDLYLGDDDPKAAVELLFRRGGVNLQQVASQIYSNSASENQMETESTPDTSSPQKSEPQSNEA